jgi:hypothetical protein
MPFVPGTVCLAPDTVVSGQPHTLRTWVDRPFPPGAALILRNNTDSSVKCSSGRTTRSDDILQRLRSRHRYRCGRPYREWYALMSLMRLLAVTIVIVAAGMVVVVILMTITVAVITVIWRVRIPLGVSTIRTPAGIGVVVISRIAAGQKTKQNPKHGKNDRSGCKLDGLHIGSPIQSAYQNTCLAQILQSPGIVRVNSLPTPRSGRGLFFQLRWCQREMNQIYFVDDAIP